MRLSKSLLAMLIACAPAAWAAQSAPKPYISYIYPAGGRQEAVFSVTVGGENLRGASEVFVSGEGVRASVSLYEGPTGLLTPPQLQELRSRLEELRDKFMAGRAGRDGAGAPPAKAPAAPDAAKPDAAKRQPVALPDLPELRNLDQMTPRQLRAVADKFVRPYFGPNRPKPPLAEKVTLQVTIAPGAAPGDRELRLRTADGLTNPVVFQVGGWPEVREQTSSGTSAAVNPPVDLPVVLNGQIMPGEADRFPFRARRGQKLAIAVHARHLIPYLADAVPGWFQAVATLYDAKGNELAVADHYRFHPDPVILFEVPEDGLYTLEVHDSLFRGRQDFVYRATIGEQPFITQMFPLGGKAGTPAAAAISGWNLPERQLQLDTQPGAGHIRQAAWRGNDVISNEVPYAVDSLPESDAAGPGNAAQPITLPRIINGRIARPGDAGVFRFEGRAGEDVVAEVYARRLGSPLDSLLRLTDASGKVLAWNDDHEDPGAGLLTHQADSYLSARLPADGAYEVHLTDAQNGGSDAHAYRLRISPPRPDFALFVTPSSINAGAGRTVAVCVHAVRKDGFAGEIEVALKDGEKSGFSLSGARIPGGRDQVCMTLTAPRTAPGRPLTLEFEGRARIGAASVVRPATPADEMMQAFAYEHLVPAQQLMAMVTTSRRWLPAFALADAGPVRLPAGGGAQVRVLCPFRAGVARAAGGDIQLELSDPPKGVTLADAAAAPGGMTFTLKAAADAPVGYADNLIVEACVDTAAGRPGSPAAKQKRRVSLGVFPAIPFEIVRP